MKTVLITAGENIIIRNILQTDFWPAFQARAIENKWSIVFVTTPELEADLRGVVGSDVRIVQYRRGAVGTMEAVLMTLARSAVNSHTNLWSKMRSYHRGDSTLVATWLKRVLTATLGNFDWYKRFLRRLILGLPSDDNAAQLFNEIKPDCLIPLSAVNLAFDIPLSREAKRRRIPVVGMVRSWDNFSSHGLLMVVPDVFILQNQFLLDMARQYQAVGSNNGIRISGLPHYDRYYGHTPTLSRDELCAVLGCDAEKKIILYGAMGNFLFTREADMPRVLNRIVEASGLKDAAQVVYRDHPKFVLKDTFADLPHVRRYTPASYTGENRGIRNEDILMSTILHADCIVTGASTFAIDAYALNKSVICVGFDGEGTVPYWESVARFYDTYTHFEAFVQASHVDVVATEAQLRGSIIRELSSTGLSAEARERVLDLFVEPYDGRAGIRLAELLSSAVAARTR